MTDALKLGFGPFTAPAKGVWVVFCDDHLKFGPATAKALASATGLVARAAKAEHFTGKSGSTLELSVRAAERAVSRWNSPAAPAGQLRKLGVEVEILDVKAMTKLGMGALLGVGQGSTQPGRTVIMRWNGGKRGDAAGGLSSARASASIPAAFRSRGRPAWRT
jgi:hypothetical protein